MKRMILTSVMAVVLALSGASTPLFAQGGPGNCGGGFCYGGPPKSAEERAARQAACLDRNGGVCPNGGPRAACPSLGKGQGRGGGYGWRHGACDGTGPRAGSGVCPTNGISQSQK